MRNIDPDKGWKKDGLPLPTINFSGFVEQCSRFLTHRESLLFFFCNNSFLGLNRIYTDIENLVCVCVRVRVRGRVCVCVQGGVRMRDEVVQ